jgi:glyoxylate reductase
MKTIVYFARALPGGDVERLAEKCDIRGRRPRPPPREVIYEEARDAEVYAPTYLDRVDQELLERLPKLRLVASYGVGTDHIDLGACRAHGVTVTNTPDVLTDTTADLAFALVLATSRRVCEGDRLIRAGAWTEVDPAAWLATDVTRKTLGIVGFGRIGQAVARRASGFAMRVIYTSNRPIDFPGAHRVDLEALLRESDIVSLHCPLTPATRGLLSRERIRMMKKGAIVVNTARGAVVDDDALAEALAEGHLGGAGLDVFRDEPRVPEAFKKLENVVLTPHIGSATRETRTGMGDMVIAEIERYASGQPQKNPVH